MINSYKQRYVCEPVYTMAGRLVAMEVLTSFTTPEGNAVSYNDVTDILTPEYKWLNFVRQLYGVSCWQNWLVRHHIVISLNVDADTAVWLLRDKAVLSMIAKMPFIRLEVHEHFPTSDKEKRGLLHHLRPHASMWLDDVGSGSHNNFGLLIRGYFSGAKIDKSFFWQHHVSDKAWLGKVIRDLTRFAGNVIVEGVEHTGHTMALMTTPHCWLQGHLFQRTDIDRIPEVPLWINSVLTTPSG
ncbi:EAL domain-containing protein [Citrobacter freundii complex sp. 2024EL-00228]|jgi:EAL domain-containing protein (putative c-di-GMP-specific phosphodiesterase class I)|uniref:EAL domain-containing protein n=4 Tax=Citrobacter freundii TaxID=546 RepID=A0A9P3Z198_CITFR|nr:MULTISPECIES: EAL domain-containing protein [Citrobacter]POV63113.1 hypothetical protein C3404_11495 [Citrobacter freundii complex sp. CFNIH11]ANZ87466.1 hypothetical protein CfB38_2546 [Citrobacter freundii]ASJ99361.1 hypothetical protein CFA70_03540 [Citrobacter freundii]AYL51572.1 hypothetical protein CUC47_08535 [Citrobacter freundii]AYY46846.1 EAL domain-containing protein [Citrobacter freundii]